MTATELLAELRQCGIELRLSGERLHYSAPRGVLTPRLRAQLVDHKNEIKRLLAAEEEARGSTSSPITRIPRTGPLPLSFAQERLWFLDQLESNSAAYQINVALRLAGPLDIALLGKSLQEVVRRHEVLRTSCSTVGGQPVLSIADDGTAELTIRDLREMPQSEREDEARRLVNREAGRPLALERAGLLRAMLLRLDAQDHVLFLATHHFVADGWSMRVLMRELAANYTAYVSNVPPPLDELEVQYVDVANWQRTRLSGELLERQRRFWKERLAGAAGVLELPTDRPRPAVQTFAGDVEPFELPRSLGDRLKELGRRERATLFMTLLTAFQTLLGRYSNQKDVVVGTTASLRNRLETEGLIGTFANNLPLRADLSGDPTFRELLGRVRDTTLEAFAHQDLPFEMLVDELQPERDLSRNPLFQVALVLHQDTLGQNLELPGLTVSPFPIDRRQARFDLALDMVDSRLGLSGTLEYNTALFDAETVRRMLRHFRVLLEAAAADADRRISDLPLLDDAERRRVLVDWNRTEPDVQAFPCVHRMFEAQVERDPDAVAVAFQKQRLTYRELNERANKLAHELQRRGVGPETLVAICIERSPQMVVALLGVLKAGGAYVPLDPAYPTHRLAFMLQDSQAAVLITDSSLPTALSEHTHQIVRLDDENAPHSAESDSNPHSGVGPEHLAYVIYTSGSTGKPKGVQIEHAALSNFLQSMRYQPAMTDEDVMLAVTTLSFDIAALELFLPLLVGGRVVLVGRDVASDGQRLLAAVHEHGVTIMQATPVTWQLLCQAGTLPKHLKVLSGGEALSTKLAEAVRQQVGSLWNMYGPTETTIWSTLERVESVDPVLIGRPIANTQVYVLDDRLNPVPVGVQGELYIGGAGLARGYLNRPELTAEKFVPDPFSDRAEARMYRTGDLARWHADGRLECLGRTDHQVKIRGHRIELGEIDSLLGRCAGVRQTAVIVREDEPGDKRLVAYVVPGPGHEISVDRLRGDLAQALPAYMVPQAFVVLGELPLTPNGKVDRRSLPAPDPNREPLGGNYVAPRTPVERQLAGIWSEVLKIERVGIDDNFFELGGHSLLATQVMSRIRQILNVDLPLRNLFETPTIAELSATIAASDAGQQETLVERPAGDRTPDNGAVQPADDRLFPPRPEAPSEPQKVNHGRSPSEEHALSDSLPARTRGDAPHASPIRRRPRGEPLPLSSAQQRLWLLQQLEPEGAAYHIAIAYRLSGPLDQDALERSLAELARRHEVLRTIYLTPDGEPLQKILDGVEVTLPAVDLSGVAADKREIEVARQARDVARVPFRLECEAPLRCRLMRLAENEHVLVLVVNHVACDGWSLQLLVRELGQVYDAICSGQPTDLPQKPIEFADFALWQRESLDELANNRVAPDDWSGASADSLAGGDAAGAAGHPGPATDRPVVSPRSGTGDADADRDMHRTRRGALHRQREYWVRQMRGAPAVLEIPTDFPRPAIETFRGDREALVLPASLIAALKRLSHREGATLYMTLLAAFQTLLCRYTGQEDVVVGSPISGRNRVEIEKLVGCFINTLLLRTDLSGDPTFRELLARVRNVTLDAYANQEFPFEMLVEELQPERRLSHSPLFQVLFVMQNTPKRSLTMQGLQIEPVEVNIGTAQFDLTAWLNEKDDGSIKVLFEYNTDLFRRSTMVRLLEHFQMLLQGIVDCADRRISELPLLTPDEEQQLLVDWNAIEAEPLPLPAGDLVHKWHSESLSSDGNNERSRGQQAALPAGGWVERFEAQAERTPDAVAAVFHDRRLSYGELNAEANRLAHLLRKRGVDRETRVGICLERSLEMLVSVLAVNKAGGTYVPLDPGFPPPRLSFMLEDSHAPLLVTQTSVKDRLDVGRADVLCLDVERDAIDGCSDENPNVTPGPESLAYMIYTSGSTGKPKGVQIPHRALVNFLDSMRRAPGLDARDTLLAVTTLSFDIAALELMLPLVAGGRVVIADAETAGDGQRLARAIQQHAVTLMQATPATWRLLLAADGVPAGIKVLCGGEPLPADLADQLLEQKVELWNMYGPTETTIWSTIDRVDSTETITIGRPIRNTQVYVLDRHRRPVPIGVPGELYIGGEGVARGYWNRPKLTEEKFVLNPFSNGPGARMYRTGDIARWRDDGRLQCLGRTDHQVKIRGYRIELGEIEAVLNRHPQVREAAVIVREDSPGDKRLVAYVTGEAGRPPGTNELREFLQADLPDYMLPSAFIPLDELPLTPNGKIDRRALPAPGPDRPDLKQPYVPPSTPIEEILAEIWAEIFQLDRVGTEDNFFDLGGHSLLAVRLYSRMARRFKKTPPLTTLFQATTIKQLAAVMEQDEWLPPRSSLVEIQTGGSRPPLYCVHLLGGHVLGYHRLAPHLGADQPVYGLEARGLDGRQAPHTRIEDMAAQYIQEIRKIQPEGPYHLAGVCFGGLVAYEMAQQLAAQGESVALLALIETFLRRQSAGSRDPRLRRSARKFGLYWNRFWELGSKEKLAFVMRRLRHVTHFKMAAWRMLSRFYRRIGRPLPHRLQLKSLSSIHFEAARAYHPCPYPGRVNLFVSRNSPEVPTQDPRLAWRKLAGEGALVDVFEGSHDTIHQEPYLGLLGEQLKQRLHQAQTEHARSQPYGSQERGLSVVDTATVSA